MAALAAHRHTVADDFGLNRGDRLEMTVLFTHMRRVCTNDRRRGGMDENEGFSDGDIAIVGMAAHLPGADGIDAYWRNLVSGTRSIRRLTDEELRRSGEAPHMLAETTIRHIRVAIRFPLIR